MGHSLKNVGSTRPSRPHRIRRVVGGCALAVVLAAPSGCGEDLPVGSTAPFTQDEPGPPQGISAPKPIDTAPPSSMAVEEWERPPTTPPPTTELPPPVFVDFGVSSAECLPDEGRLVLADRTTFWSANDGEPYISEFWPVAAHEGSPVSVSTHDTQADFDDDGRLDTLQTFSVVTADSQVSEGLRVCGTSQEMKTYYVGPTNGNFGAIPVLLDGPDGIVPGPPVDRPGPEDVLLFSDDGYLLPPYARNPANSNTPGPSSAECLEASEGDVVDSIVVIERLGEFIEGHLLRDAEVQYIETQPGGDFDGDGTNDTVQWFGVYSDDGRADVLRVCGTTTHLADWIQANPNKPISFWLAGPQDTVVRGSSAGGAGIYEFDFEAVDGLLTMTDLELVAPGG